MFTLAEIPAYKSIQVIRLREGETCCDACKRCENLIKTEIYCLCGIEGEGPTTLERCIEFLKTPAPTEVHVTDIWNPTYFHKKPWKEPLVA